MKNMGKHGKYSLPRTTKQIIMLRQALELMMKYTDTGQVVGSETYSEIAPLNHSYLVRCGK